jgi:RNA polymerase sigma factor (sigma-70 family)
MKLYSMDEPADKIYLRHRGMIRSLINSIVVNNPSVVDTQDLQQVGALALIVALKSYDPSLGSFSGYIRKCVHNALLEQANSFNPVFTVDEKVRRQANSIVRLRREGLSDGDIMTRLGIKTPATFLSLLGLVKGNAIDIDKTEVVSELSFEVDGIFKILDEIGLTESETQFIGLITKNHSMDDIIGIMEMSRSHLYTIKASIRDKILGWGQDN